MTTEAKRQLKVFLCHASGDKPPVRELYRRLVAEGVDAWLDQEKLLPGQDWRVEIPRAVRGADVVVICLSNKSITKEGYVQKEIKFALDSADEKPDGAIFLIPARLEDCIVPERLSRWQWVDLYEEKGFIKLLRSLKLRAAAVEAVIEPVSYEDTDEERKRRLDQLYTEGLAAFYTEDWDLAYRRFQAILSEQPNHRGAAEKLEEAENQRLYANLYAQATEAYQSENWLLAITTLEELLQKAADYKDAAQLLRDARKREQLTELYTEARALHAARQWQAVVRVFEQIAVIEPNYPDVNELLATAQKEVAELEQLAQLNKRYSLALHEMDSGNWHEARTLLEQVHKTRTGFLDTERLLRKVENEILKIEELNRRNIQVNTLYEQVHKLVRSKNWQKAFDTIEKIQKLDDRFVDKDGIFERVRTELDREGREAQRQREQDALYAEAVSLLEAKKYQEALEKWNSIQAVNPRYRDSARVKKTARRKLEELSRPERVGRPWPKIKTVWFRTEVNIPSDREILTERLLLLSFVGVVIIHILLTRTANLFLAESSIGSIALLFLLFGLYGMVVTIVYKIAVYNWRLPSSLILIGGWALSPGVALIIERYFAGNSSFAFMMTKVFTALSLALALKWAKVSVGQSIISFTFWTFAWWSGHLLGEYLGSIFNIGYTWAVADAFAISLGLLLTFGIQNDKSVEVLKTAFFGAFGFAIGSSIANLLSALSSFPAEILYAVWGSIGGAIMEAPSRNSHRILFSAAMCGGGLLVGSYIAFDVLPALGVVYANIAFTDRNITLYQLAVGLGIGLGFGLLVRRASAMGILVVLGAGIFLIVHALNVMVFHFPLILESVVRGALIGFVLGFGYAYLGGAKLPDGRLQTSKTKWVLLASLGFLASVILIVNWRLSALMMTSYRWDFDHSTEGWRNYNNLGSAQIKNGALLLRSTGFDPFFESPASLSIPANKAPIITVRMRMSQGRGTVGQIFFVTNQNSNWSESKSVEFTLSQDGIYQTYNILMAANPSWRGIVTGIRLDPVGDPTNSNVHFAIDYISVHAP